jgi:hypothetical protein
MRDIDKRYLFRQFRPLQQLLGEAIERVAPGIAMARLTRLGLDPFRQSSGTNPLRDRFDEITRQRKRCREQDGLVARYGGLDRQRSPRVPECDVNDVPEVDRIGFRHAGPGAKVPGAAGKLTCDRTVVAPTHGNDTVTVPLTIPPLMVNVLDVLQASGACPPELTLVGGKALVGASVQVPAMTKSPDGLPD